MKTAIAILNWNGEKLLPQFLPSVINNSKNATIYVIDNASTDNSIELLTTQFPSVKIIQNKGNYGFAQGYNEGLKEIDAEYFCLLNSDVEVTENWIEPIEKLFDNNLDIAAIQPKILDYKNKEYFEYAHLKIEDLRSHQTEYESECDELCEEHVDGYFNPDNFNDSKVSRANVKKRLRDVVGEEKTAMQQYLDYQDEMTEAKKEIAKAEADLLEQVKAKYQWLRGNEPEVKRLVIHKWIAALTENILSEMQRIVENLNSQVTTIAERYEQTLAEINSEVSEHESKVMQHLEKMGFKI